MVAKQPLPNDLPSASKTRNIIFTSFWLTMADAIKASGDSKSDETNEDATTVTKDVSSLLHPPSENEDEWEGSTLGAHEVGVLPSDPAMLHTMMRSDSWLRFYSFAMAIKMLSVEVDALSPLFKDLFGELPGFTLPAVKPFTDGLDLRPVLSMGRKGRDTEQEMYGIDDKEEVERIEGIPKTTHDSEEVKI
ncbi:hypothetical protein HDU67_008072 [Dinochytrium kinnereticum]|nr:hypothetical protein HDU67_008072 [Dinochytrium kinnereticum]